MNSEFYYLCKEIILWWDTVKDQYIEMPGFVKRAIYNLGEAVMMISNDENDDENEGE